MNVVGEAFLITLREGFEAALIVAIVLAAVRAQGRPELRRWVWLGTGAALAALATGDAAAYRDAVLAIVRDFEGRDAHLTGVPVADTAMLMEALAAPRGMAANPDSPVFPPG